MKGLKVHVHAIPYKIYRERARVIEFFGFFLMSEAPKPLGPENEFVSCRLPVPVMDFLRVCWTEVDKGNGSRGRYFFSISVLFT